jgi:hypothetical protein
MSIDTDPRADLAVPAPPVTGGPPPATELPTLPARRNPRWTALGIVALCLGALLSYVIYARVAAETTVVSVAQTVYRGEQVEPGDLTTTRVRAGTVAGALPAGEVEALVGQRAVYDLPAGSVVQAGSVAAVAVPGPGRAAVGIRLVGGRAPQVLLLPSSPIRLVALPPASSDGNRDDQLGGRTFPARVIDQAPAPDGTSILLNVDVAESQAATVALLAAQERLAVVRDAGR